MLLKYHSDLYSLVSHLLIHSLEIFEHSSFAGIMRILSLEEHNVLMCVHLCVCVCLYIHSVCGGITVQKAMLPT